MRAALPARGTALQQKLPLLLLALVLLQASGPGFRGGGGGTGGRGTGVAQAVAVTPGKAGSRGAVEELLLLDPDVEDAVRGPLVQQGQQEQGWAQATTVQQGSMAGALELPCCLP